MKLVIGSASKELGEAVAKKLGIQPSFVQISRFADGETSIQVEDDICNQEVYVIQSTSSPSNDNLMELLLILDTVKRLRAKKITAIIPYYGYSRQERVIKNNNMQSALSAKLVANLIQVAGASNIVTFDLHSSQIEGFFDIPVSNLSSIEVFVSSMHCSNSLDNLVVVAPDVGAIGKARSFAKDLEERSSKTELGKIVVIDKHRKKAGVSQVLNILGKVTEKNCIIVDDIIDSGGTLCNAALALKIQGAKSVISFVTHGVLSGNKIEKNSSSLDKLVITDTIFHKFKKNSKIEVISIADILVSFIKRESINVS